MNRRVFMGRAGSVAAVTTLSRLDGVGAAGCANTSLGVQLWTVRDALQEDPRGVVGALRDLGIEEAEMFGLDGGPDARLLGLPASELKQLFDVHGLRAPFAQIGGELTNVSANAELYRLWITVSPGCQ